MKKLYLKVFSVILALSAIMLTFSLSTTLFKVKATDAVGVETFTTTGVSVRQGDPENPEDDTTGIRFFGTISKTKFENLTNNVAEPVYFGMELTANDVPVDICYLVDDVNKITNIKNQIIFKDGQTEYQYTASITYTKATLKADLETALGTTLTDQQLNDYLNEAYGTEITARVFYRVGEEGVKKYDDSESITRSMWGLASYWLTEAPEDYSALANKYFTEVNEETEVELVYETGAFGYTFNANDKVYCGSELVELSEGKLPASLYRDKQIGDKFILNVVSEEGALNTLNVTIGSMYEIIDTQAYYDSAKDIIYFNGMEDTIQGSATSTFAYVVDNETSYALGSYDGEGAFTSNVNYKYADSVSFDTRTSGMSQSDTSFGYLMNALKPKIKHAGGTVDATIPYNAHTDEYTGVTISVEHEGKIYKFTDAIIVSEMIDDATELDRIFNQPDGKRVAEYLCVLRSASVIEYGTITKGVYMLAKDIDCSTDFNFDNSYWNYFEGVFDGRGHTISNLDVSGTEDNPGNGLFSATSLYSTIQNVAFTNVTANYGSVFQGNQFDHAKSLNTVLTYYMVHSDSTNVAVGTDGATGLGSIYYRRQLVDDSDTTTTIGQLLKSDRRGASSTWGQGGYFANVYVQVNPETTRLMGVISRNMANSANTVRAYNMVIEYLPTTLYDSEDGTVQGALPYDYGYTQGLYGVLFGGAYTPTNATGSQYDKKDASHVEKNEDGTYKRITFFTPNGNTPNGQAIHNEGALIFHQLDKYYAGRVNFASKVYVISTVGLVSSAQGAILGTNVKETDDTVNNPYRFVTKSSYYYNPNTHGVVSKLETYKDYTEASNSGYNTNNLLTSFYLDGGAEEKYWDISKGYLDWKEVKDVQ